MKEIKPYYYKFEWKDRLITLCLVYEDQDEFTSELYLGYSVKTPEDKLIEGLSEKIALGRAVKWTTRYYIGDFITDADCNLKQDKGFMKAIARNIENNIKKGKIVIKGIR